MDTKRENDFFSSNIIHKDRTHVESLHTVNKEENTVFEEQIFENEAPNTMLSNKHNNSNVINESKSKTEIEIESKSKSKRRENEERVESIKSVNNTEVKVIDEIEEIKGDEERPSASNIKLEKDMKEKQIRDDIKKIVNGSSSDIDKDREVNQNNTIKEFENRNSSAIGIEQNAVGRNEVKNGEEFKERAGDVQVDKSGVYNIKDSGSGDSLLIGTDIYTVGTSSQYANAFVEGIKACPEVLEIPGTLTDLSGKTRPVEIIGRGAFIACGFRNFGGKTKRLKVPRQVKVIKWAAFGCMYDLDVFEIEAGSMLKTIEEYGLEYIGRYTVLNDSNKRNGILILPSTLSSVYKDGIFRCDLFRTVIYCGSHLLSNSSELEYDVWPNTVVKVTSQYPSNEKIFDRSPDRSSKAETENTCKDFLSNPFPNYLCSPLKHSSRPILALAVALLSSNSLSSLLSPSFKSFSTSNSFLVSFV